MGKNLTSQNDQSNGPYSTSKNNHPNHIEHVKINLSKMIEWFFLCLFKLGIFKLDFPIKKTKFSSSKAKFWALITYIDIASYHNSIIMHNMAIGCSWQILCTIKNSSFTIQVRWWVARWWTSCCLFEKKTFFNVEAKG